ncbi:hypothetical protein LEP1GSC064_1337 [Leptospira kirschneri serovar Grippotyphosa str. Moskva]|nr:hypothetical protein LEP1GSC044_0899 [Leptospira kirschneri serovar Grippotyphosa str. RM52]EKQ83100.1 hypothetical protein LEP1GSC064_1337 [Leptospira kirschneri serovar Grippotyphosa str. Moskva]EKR07838.1 hypothetical protein LEP1GSC122_2080 [Leptospira kirschneri serovar Valbuzzi str. 200702274]EMK00175.1 hypothetical protein LEP1GSC176_3846 [Leptospira kirschneri str. MMD1493]EMN23996.1 hypothetical protein LEP1GSC065_0315 [Leptospira kirschneri serovar Sokoine str. RM1]EMO79515.1 hypo
MKVFFVLGEILDNSIGVFEKLILYLLLFHKNGRLKQFC